VLGQQVKKGAIG